MDIASAQLIMAKEAKVTAAKAKALVANAPLSLPPLWGILWGVRV